MRAHRSWVLASLRQCCDLCGGTGHVLSWPPGVPELAAAMPCPHCGPLHLPLPLDGPDRPRRLMEAHP